MTYNEAVKYIVSKRKAELDNYAIAFEHMLINNPKFLELEKKLRVAQLDFLKTKSSDASKTISELEKKRVEFTKNLPLPLPSCNKCKDTAFFNDSYCECAKRLVINNSTNFEIEIIPKEKADFSRIEKAHQKHNREFFENCHRVIEKFPENKRRLIVALGSTGVGKSFLASTLLSASLKKGLTVTAVTAFSFNTRSLKYHTTFDNTKQDHIAPLLDSDILIIDDLGTESILNNVTVEYLYTVISQRLSSKKLTIITANLSKEGIEQRYGRRISSRLFDSELSYFVIMGGKDLRE